MNFHLYLGACARAVCGRRPAAFASPKYLPIVIAWSAAWFILSGCGETEIPKIPDDQQNINYILRAYCKFNGEQQRTAASLDELKPLLKEFGDPEKIILSPRDGQPYVLVGGLVIGRMPSGGELPVVAYERQGVNGKRQVVDLRGKIRELTPEEFKQLKFPPSHKPPE